VATDARAATAVPPAFARAGATTGHPGWIHSPAFDLALFTLSPIAGLLVLWANYNVGNGPAIIILATYLVAIPHYVGSFTFYLGDDNLAYYRTRRLAFFVGPVVIVALVVLLRVLNYDRIVQSTMFTWNIYHVAAQSAGILALYRTLNGGDRAERTVARTAILATNATMAFWYIDRYPPLFDLLSRLHPYAPWALRGIALPIAIVSLIALGLRLARRARGVSVPEWTFLASSLLLFHPYLWVEDANLATFGMLMGHFIQYLAIVGLLNQRKYAGSGGSTRQQLLGRVSAHPLLLGGAIITTGVVFYAANGLSAALGAPMVYVVAWNGLTLVHFYLDGLVWALRRPQVRASIAPYLMPPANRAA
jgi:hypothetical protein